MTGEIAEGDAVISSIRFPPVVGEGTPTCKREKKQVTEHHKMDKFTALEKGGSKQKKVQIEEGHTTSSLDD